MASVGDRLLEDVYKNPADDGPRQVLADWLIEKGDPRGELIALQLRPRATPMTPQQAARERSLLHAHWKKWAGPLAPHLMRTGLVFERGFLTRCKTSKLVGEQTWGTVEHLGLCKGAGTKDGAIPLITHPVMRALRSVSGLDAKRMTQLASFDRALPLTAVELECTHDVEAKLAATVRESKALPHVRTLGVCVRVWGRAENPVPELAWLFGGSLFRRIERLRIAKVGPLPALLNAMTPLERLREIEVVRLWELCLHNDPSGVRFRFSRGNDERFSVLEIVWPDGDVLRDGRPLPQKKANPVSAARGPSSTGPPRVAPAERSLTNPDHSAAGSPRWCARGSSKRARRTRADPSNCRR